MMPRISLTGIHGSWPCCARGDDDGWLTLRLTELNKDFRFCYSDCDEWKQLTRLDGKVYATFRITFTEPNPDYNYSSNNG